MAAYAKPVIFPASPRQHGKAARTRRAMLDAFRKQLAELPFDRIIMAKVSRVSGVSRSTLYRAFANTTELLWATVYPSFDAAVSAALRADRVRFLAELDGMVSTKSLVQALVHADARDVRAKLAALITARIETVVGRRHQVGTGIVLAGAWFAVLEGLARGSPLKEDALPDLLTISYVAAHLAPGGTPRLPASAPAAERFPPAVSIEESLASDDHILSMIDGRPYRTLTRHIARFGLTPEAYRRCFGLEPDYPMVARGYSALRREIAADAGLGRTPRARLAA
jgi:predicted transcriptional regulator